MTTTKRTSRVSMDESTSQDHWEYELRGTIDEKLEAKIGASLGIPLPSMARKNGAFGYVYYNDSPGGAVVKIGNDWLEAGMSAWIMRRQRGRTAIAPLLRAAFPRIIDAVKMTYNFPAAVGEFAYYVTVREDVEFSSKELYKAVEEKSGVGQVVLVEGLMRVVQSAGQAAREFIEEVFTFQDPRDVSAVRAKFRGEWGHLTERFNGSATYMSSDQELERAIRALFSLIYTLATKHGIGITDLHDGNIRFRADSPARGWEQSYYPAPVISDYGMSAVKKASGVLRQVELPNPLTAWERPRLVRL